MRGTPVLIVALLATAVSTGCVSSPWSSRRAGGETASSPQSGVASASVAAAAAAANTAIAPPTGDVAAEVQRLGLFQDKAAEEKLVEDLKKTDPSFWPLVIRQFRAAEAYRRQSEQRRLAAAGAGGDAAADFDVRPQEALAAVPHGSGVTPASAFGRQFPPEKRQADPTIEERFGRLPVAGEVALPPAAPPQGVYPSTPHAPVGGPHADLSVDGAQSAARSGPVLHAAFSPPSPGLPQAHLEAAIRAMESELAQAPKSPEVLARLAQLRMLYLVAGQRDAAMRPLPAATPALQEFWSKQMYGLATWLDTQRTPDEAGRAAEAKRILDEALGRLGESAPLVVRSLAFCTEVQSYGCIKPFRSNEFTPEQEVLLYAEVENFAAESTPKGYHTKMRSSYQIFDSRGQRVAEHDFTVTEEYCQNPRRDFFIGYHLRLPGRIYPGKHTLQLTIEDLKSQKVGQSSIDFAIKEPVAERKR